MVKIIGKTYLLSGFYSEIIIYENNGDFRVKVNPDERIKVKKLDKAYNHLDLSGLSDIEIIKTIIDYYLRNNTISIISNYSRKRGYSLDFKSLNANISLLDNYSKNYGRALYFNLSNEELSEDIDKMLFKYKEDRIKKIDDILNSNNIVIQSSPFTSMYKIEDKETFIEVLSQKNENFEVNSNEKEFIKDLLLEFMKRYGCNIRYIDNRCILFSCDRDRFVNLYSNKFHELILNAKYKYLDYISEDINQLTLKLN